VADDGFDLARYKRRQLWRKLGWAAFLALILGTCGVATYSNLEHDAAIREGR
jgi:hypothetical protein